MTKSFNQNPIDKIITVIKRKGGIATLTGIKRSISEFNQSGGVEKLRQYLDDLITKGVIAPHTEKGSNGRTIETFRLTSRYACNGSNVGKSNGNDACNDNYVNLTITVTLEAALEGLTDILHSWLGVDGCNGDDGTADTLVDDTEVSDCDDDTFNDHDPFDDDTYTPDENDYIGGGNDIVPF
jgi:hypothetical protein